MMNRIISVRAFLLHMSWFIVQQNQVHMYIPAKYIEMSLPIEPDESVRLFIIYSILSHFRLFYF